MHDIRDQLFDLRYSSEFVYWNLRSQHDHCFRDE